MASDDVETQRQHVRSVVIAKLHNACLHSANRNLEAYATTFVGRVRSLHLPLGTGCSSLNSDGRIQRLPTLSDEMDSASPGSRCDFESTQIRTQPASVSMVCTAGQVVRGCLARSHERLLGGTCLRPQKQFQIREIIAAWCALMTATVLACRERRNRSGFTP